MRYEYRTSICAHPNVSCMWMSHLECGTHVLRPDHGPELLGVDGLIDLGEEAGEVINLMLAHGLPLLGSGSRVVLQCHLECVVAVEKGDHLVLGKHKALLDALLTLPALLVGLALNENDGMGVSIPDARNKSIGSGSMTGWGVMKCDN